MLDNLLKQKLNTVSWIALLHKNNINDAIFVFNNYILALQDMINEQNDEAEKRKTENEISNAYKIYISALFDTARKNFDNKNYEDASMCYVELLKYKEDNPEILMNLAVCMDNLGLYGLEAELTEYIGKFAPINLYDFYYKTSEKFSKTNNLQLAIKYRRKALLSIKSPSIHDYNNLGDLYNQYYSEHTENLRCALKSLACFKKASNMEPNMRVFAKNATIMAGKANQWDEYKFFWDRMLKIGNMTNDDKFDYACYCLKTKNIEGWYKYSDARFQKENNRTQFPKLKKPYWDGKTDISNSTLLIHYEQGFGDSILFSGYIYKLQKCAKKLIMVVQDELAPLIQRSFPYLDVKYQSKTNTNILQYDYYVPAMSIPKVLNLDISEFSVGAGYLLPNEQKVDYFKNKYFHNDKLKIGISCSGNNTGNKTRDIPLNTFLMLDELENVELYSLTKGLPDVAFRDFKKNKVHNLTDEFNNFDDTAAIMTNCDLIITADNVILNLAGALGKKTFALFNWSYEFRWFDLTGDDVILYPTVKPFVNTSMNNWASSMSAAIEEIKKL